MYFLKRIFIFCIFLSSHSVNAINFEDSLNTIFSSTPSSVDEVLHPDDAFKVAVSAISNNRLILNWQIKPGYYLYKDKFSINSNDSSIIIGSYVFPIGKLKEDLAFGEVEVYYNNNQLLVPFTHEDTNIKELNINIGYQGCKEDSICYPPIKKNLTVSIPDFFEALLVDEGINKEIFISEQDVVTKRLKENSLLFNIFSFFVFGFLLALTPCVFPMIPILSGIIVGEGVRITRTRAIMLTLSYVLAMALTYAVLGVIAGLFSFNLQAASQNIWVISLFSGVFVLLALSMFGFYELQLPSSWQNKVVANQSNSGRGTLTGAALMGLLSAVIVGPCVAPPLAGALLYISQTGDAQLGGLALFAMGLGFGVPLLIIGISSGELLPRAGAWMNNIKRVFGVIMLGVAIWFLERVLPETFTLLLWAALFIVSAIFLGALDRQEKGINYWQRLHKGLGLMMMFYGGILIYAAVSGGGTVLAPFNKRILSNNFTTETLPFVYIANISELNEQLEQSKLEGKSAMLDFYADWCVECKQMEAHTFSKPLVQDILQDINLLKADVTENNDADKILLKHFGLFGPPAIIFFNQQSEEIKSHRLIGFSKPENFIKHIKQVKSL
jgi:thiol:disulfide interchange protein DsbD|tara:strand:- start:197 stop:2029 length:1833 start_codon:yes stop_codon:yes gene_type:complete